MDTITTIKLTAAGARKVLDAALAAAAPTGRPVSVAVCDAGGNLMAFQQSEDAEIYTINVALNKARAAALTQFATGRMSPIGNLRDDHHCFAITMAAGPENFVSMEGGVPIKVNGTVIGGVSVSGAGRMDQDLAQMAADTITE